MNESQLRFADNFWTEFIIDIVLDSDSAITILQLFYNQDKEFQQRFEGYLNLIYEKVLEDEFRCLSSSDQYLKLPFKTFFTVFDWYVDALKKLNSGEEDPLQHLIDKLPTYDVNEITYEYMGHHNLHTNPQSARLLIDLKNSSPKKSLNSSCASKW